MSREVTARERHDLIRRRVTHDDEHGVVRRVVGLEEAADVIERSRLEVLEVAVEVVGVVPVGVGLLGQTEPLEGAVRLVQDVDAYFLAHDVLLVPEVLGGDVQRSHPVGLQPERQLERVRRDDLEVVRVIEARGPVHHAAVRLHDLDVLELADMSGALEHHVLEEMREAGPALRLDAEADLVHDLHGRDGRGMILAHDDLKAVRQLVVKDGDGGRGAARRHRRVDVYAGATGDDRGKQRGGGEGT
jgi:hypothetical protein